jgi:Ca2+-binding RTX toxin-like protein
VTVTLSGGGSGSAQSTASGDLAGVGIDTFTGVGAVRGSGFADKFNISVDNTPTAIDGLGGIDTVNYSAYNTSLTVTLTGSTPAIVHGSGLDDAHSDTIFNVENFIGGTGADTVTGDGSNNTYFATVDNVRDVFDGGTGSDTANYSAYSAALTVALNGNTPVVVQGSGSNDANSDTIVNVENFVGGTRADIVTGDGFNNTYSATVDNVRDIFDGGTGNDTADYSAYAAALSVTLTLSTPAIVHGSGSDDAHSDTIANVENVIGGSANDFFAGDANNNIFTGGAGFDQASYQSAVGPISVSLAAGTVTGDASVGTDTLRSIEYVFGTNASDTYDASNFSSTSTNAGSNGTFNVFVGSGGDDTITGNGNTQVQYFNATSGVLITLGANGSGSASGDGSVGNDTFISGVDNVLGSNFNDTYNASAFTSSSGAFNQFQGLGGNDTITGNGSTQLYYAGSTAGISVTLNAGGGGTVTGDSSVGTDTINGGVNSIQGSNFNDTYNASTFSSPSGSFNQFLGNGGNDTITGNGNTQLYYGAPNVTSGISATLNAGGAGTVTGDSSVGSDTINGGVNNIFGSNFNDTLTLNSPGANFQSTLTGNGGNDTFVFKPNFGNTTITDFHSGQDTIDFDPTVFSDFAHVQSHMTAVGANTVITFDAGDTVTLLNVAPASLHANDFLFV